MIYLETPRALGPESYKYLSLPFAFPAAPFFQSAMSTLIYLDLVMAVLALFVAYRLYIRNSLPLPPGPKGFPIIGNAFDMPAIRSWETFARWGDQYGI